MMLKCILVLCLVALIAAYSIPDTSFENIKVQDWLSKVNRPKFGTGRVGRSIGANVLSGSSTENRKFPYQVGIEANGKFCGGAILNNTFIVTVAHCVSGLSGSDILVYVGSDYVPFTKESSQVGNKLGQLYNVKYVYVHEDFEVEDNVPVNDIALIQLTSSLTLEKNSGIYNVPVSTKKTNGTCYLAGWETIEDGAVHFSADLQYVKIKINKFSKSSTTDQPGMICASPKKNSEDISLGDSGSPLVCNGKLVGLLSWKNGCKDNYYSDVFTDAVYFRSWIIKGNPAPNE